MTWHRGDDVFRVYFNRDELRSRPPGLPPAPARRDGTDFLAPRDAEAGGTWIAAARGGLVLALLNGYVEEARAAAGDPAREPPPGGWISRGHLIERAIAAPDPDAVAERLEAEGPLDRFRSFVLIALHPRAEGRRIAWLDGRRLDAPLPDAAMPVASSSFETARVIEARRRAWAARAAERAAEPHAAHLAYHRSTIDGDGAASVCMARPDAATVSLTWIEIAGRGAAERVRMRYLGRPPCRPGPPPVESELPVQLGF